MFSNVLLLSYFVLLSCSELQDKVSRNLIRLCPEQYVPTDNITAVTYSSEYASCCTDYFNQSSGRMSSSSKTNYLEDGQSCLYPTTDLDTSYRQTTKSYYMITNAPEDGCAISDNRTGETISEYNQATCNDSEVIPFRQFLPVYSKQSGSIYKNPQCANCHGQYELIEWKTYASCNMVSAFDYDLTNCQLHFVYEGPVGDIQHLECFTDTYNFCPDNFEDDVNIPPTVDLSVTELNEACSMDQLPRFYHKSFWKNVFCYICHDCRTFLTFSFPQCVRHEDGFGRFIGNFIRTLDWGVIKKNMYMRNQGKYICGLETNVETCHEVMCPLGQMMTENEEGMTCQMDSTRWIAKNNKFVIWLLLNFDQNIANNETALKETFTLNQVQNPWEALWNIVTFYRPYEKNIDMTDVNEKSNISKVHKVESFSHAYVKISCKKNSVNPASFVRRIEQTLPKMWSFKIAGKIYRAKQSFSRSTLTRIFRGSIEQGDVLLYGVPSWHLSPYVDTHERIVYKAVVREILPRQTAHITRLMFCNQIELASTEVNAFIVDKLPITLYYNRTGKFLFDNEFTRGSSPATGDRKYRICISDTEWKYAANGRHDKANYCSLFVVILFMLLV